MTLETERLILRPWHEADAERLYEFARDPLVGPIAGWPPHADVQESLSVIQTVFSVPEIYALVPKESGFPVGCAGITRGAASNLPICEDEGEIGYWIGVPYWGRGLVPEAVRILMRRAFESLELRCLWCGWFEGNEQSRRVQEKCGFQFHHTSVNQPWPPMGDIRTEHVSRITADEWRAMQGR